MKPFRQFVPETGKEMSIAIQALLTISALETRPERIKQIPLRAVLLASHMHLYDTLMNGTYHLVWNKDNSSLSLKHLN